jgi:hypothetical protein
MLDQTEIEIARHHLQDARDRVARQCALVANLRENHCSTDVAEALLRTFVSTLAAHENHLERLLRDADIPN